MNRRTFVGLLCGGISVLAGCSTPGQLRNSGGESQAIVDRQFELVDPEDRFDENESAWDGPVRDADVQFEAAADRVVVQGHVYSGSRSCKETVLESARYDEESDTLTVVILDRSDGSNACTLEIAIVPYEATITFDSSLPDRTVVKHRFEEEGVVYSETFTSE